jgi:hypothetical protein
MLIDGDKLYRWLAEKNREAYRAADHAKAMGDMSQYAELSQRGTAYADAAHQIRVLEPNRWKDEPDHDVAYDISKILYKLDEEYREQGVILRPCLRLFVETPWGYNATSIHLDQLMTIGNPESRLRWYIDSLVYQVMHREEGSSEPSE